MHPFVPIPSANKGTLGSIISWCVVLLLGTTVSSSSSSSSSSSPSSTKINRSTVVSRHNINIVANNYTDIDPFDVLTLGNGAFAFNMDITGSQTFNTTYFTYFDLQTMSDFGFHTIPFIRDNDNLANQRYGYDIYNFTYLSTPTDGEGNTRSVPYFITSNTTSSIYGNLTTWLHNNPHRLNLGQISIHHFVSGSSSGSSSNPITTVPLDIQTVFSMNQTLDLYNANAQSTFLIQSSSYAPSCTVATSTVVDSTVDLVALQLQYSSTVPNGCGNGLSLHVAFPYGTMDDYASGSDWSNPSAAYHSSVIMNQQPNFVHILRTLDSDKYEVYCQWSDPAWTFVQTGLHTFDLVLPAALNRDNNDTNSLTNVEFSCLYTPYNLQYPVGEWMPWMQIRKNTTAAFIDNNAVPLYSTVVSNTATAWNNFWLTGSFVDLASNTPDPQAMELERRIILSLYLTRANSAGSSSPQETGLLCNSWAGKFHEEMRYWHLNHWSLWNHSDLLHRSDGFLVDILPNATSTALFQGYNGARWPKMIAPISNSSGIDVQWPGLKYASFPFDNGNSDNYGSMLVMDAGSSVGPLLLWEQPHIILMAEIQRQVANTTSGSAAALDVMTFQSPLVFATADFLASYVYYNRSNDAFWMGPPMYGAEEEGNDLFIYNPVFELVYTAWVLDLANEWRTILGLSPNPLWINISNHLPILAIDPGSPNNNLTYTLNPNCACLYNQPNCPKNRYNKTQCSPGYSHPMTSAVMGMVNGRYHRDQYGVNSTIANNTLSNILNSWDWSQAWGWDFPLLAFGLIRLQWSPEAIVNTLLINNTKNQYLRNGYNFQTNTLPAYLPGNGGLLQAIAAMTGGMMIESTTTEGLVPYRVGFPSSWIAVYEDFPIAYP